MSSFRSERERWIRDKYEQKLFLPPLPLSSEQARQSLIDAINKEDLPSVILLLAQGKIPTDDLNASLIHLAASLGNVPILQLLLWVSAVIRCVDLCLHFVLVQHGADPFALDSHSRSPLQCAHGDCIQVLQTLTNNRLDCSRPLKPSQSPAPPYDKLPSTVI